MPQYTDNLNLTKLQDNEYYDGNVENENLDKIDQALGDRVEKVEGKGLSTEDYTFAEKNKLSNIDDDANNYSHPATHSANMIETTASKRFITDVLLAKLNGIEAWSESLYEPIITRKTGFNLDKSDSVSSTSSSILATSKAVKVAYDKGVEALNAANTAQSTANGKEPAFSKKSGFNLDKSNSVSSSSSSVLATSAAARTAYNKGVEALNKANSIPLVTINSRPSSGMKVGHINVITT